MSEGDSGSWATGGSRLRNEYLIWSHHPLKHTLISQTGPDPDSRRLFLQKAWDIVDGLDVKTDWRPPEQDRSYLRIAARSVNAYGQAM